jgi:hypothetical protein
VPSEFCLQNFACEADEVFFHRTPLCAQTIPHTASRPSFTALSSPPRGIRQNNQQILNRFVLFERK